MIDKEALLLVLVLAGDSALNENDIKDSNNPILRKEMFRQQSAILQVYENILDKM